METVVRLLGPVAIELRLDTPMALQLAGRDPAQPELVVLAGFQCTAPPALPSALPDCTIESVGDSADRYRLRSAAGDWEIVATRLHIHRDWSIPLAHALRPQPVRLRTRLLWWLGIQLARWRLTRRWVLDQRRGS
ncbi:MAG: hypothetical protein NZM12_11840 [Steroidobacteraceae bacterium]|nr:hypothetical protein [Steroidobacteraceae bacterium]MDW8258932.1 hypothetical protein [Gammaproteobacteria bacterium]